MIRLSLIYRNGDREGERVTVSDTEFLIGRRNDAHLCLATRSVSRRHCIIVQRDQMAIVVDLGSRNPTLINGVPLPKHKPQRLYDRDKIQIGRIKFRLSMSDERTGEAINPMAEALSMPGSDSPTGELLNELSEIALNFGQSSDGNSITRTFNLDPGQPALRDTNNDSVDGDIDSVFGSTVELVKPDTKEISSDQVDAPEVGEDDVDDEKPGTPRKLPSHLRPKGPANSQNAAEQALRNMFNRRG